MPNDEAAVSALLAACYPVLMPASYDAEILAAALPEITRANLTLLSSGTYYLAADTGAETIAGCGGWTREHPESGDITPGLAHIRHFATRPDRVGQGVGRSIYARCETAARGTSSAID